MKVNEKFPNWLTSGGNAPADFTGFISNIVYPYYYAPDKPVFRYAYSDKVFPSVTVGTNAPWLSSLDVMFAMRFGERRLRNIVDALKFHNKSSETITSEEQRNTVIMAQMINERFADKWNHIAAALAIEYNPLENYNRVEDSNFQHSNTGADSDVKTFDNRKTEKGISGGYTDADTRGVTKGGKTKTTRNTDDNVFGFDTSSTGGVPSDKQTMIETVEYAPDSSAYTETNSGNIQRTYNTYKETETPSGTETLTHNINNGSFGWDKSNISGNIGVTTSQQMLESELEVRRNILYDIVLNDIAEFLTISIY